MPIVVARITQNDPRVQLLAYVTDGKHLFQVVKSGQGTVTLENVITEAWFVMTHGHVLQNMRLIRPAPTVPADARDIDKELV